ncbi:o-succinylbenzoate--CoA ligase [Oceanobacillus sp. CAU 1775]
MAEIIPHWLTKQANLSPNRLAFESHHEKNITFKELEENSKSYAKKLATLGVKKSTHIGILSSNQLEMIYAIHALSYLGAVGVLLNTRLTDEEIKYQLEDANVTLVITDEQEASREFQDVEQFSYADLKLVPETSASLLTEINLDDIFTIMYTSGTTGFPKGVLHTYGNHWWNAIGSALNLGMQQEDKWLITLPFFHVSGLTSLIKNVIYGMPIYFMKKFDVTAVHEAIMTKQITIVSVVTVMVQRLIEKLGEQKYPETMRCFLLGGGPAPKTMLETAKEKSIPVFQSYGMTETTSQIVTLSPEDALRKLGSAGKPLLPAQLKIENQAEDGVGEIFVKGPTVTKGYYNNQEANQATFHEGWLKTGDLGRVDAEGFLYVMDRRTDLIISGGENIYPSEIENVLMKLPEVKEAGVVGVKDEAWGQVPVAYVVLEKEISEEAILTYAETQLAKYKLPKKIHFIDALPRNAANKVMRNQLSSK